MSAVARPSLRSKLTATASHSAHGATDSTFRDIISGRRGGVIGGVSRAGLQVLSWPYGGIVGLRNVYYNVLATPARLACPVISIGNITTGGTGKTPVVAWLANALHERGRRVGILTRGYRADAAGSDEVRVLRTACPHAICVTNPDRVAGGRTALEDHDRNVLLLDDGFQHRRLHRDLDVVLIDALSPEGFGHVLPRGLLREPAAGLDRADAIVITRVGLVDADRLQRLVNNLRDRLGERLIVGCNHRPRDLIAQNDDLTALDALASWRVVATCGIGNPDGFWGTLAQLGAQTTHSLAFGDHHHYTIADCQQLAAAAERSDADAIITTEKDLVKLKRIEFDWPCPVHALRIVVDFVGQGGKMLLGKVENAIAPDALPTG